MPPLLTSNIAELLLPGHFDIFSTDMDQWPEEFSKIYNMHGSKKNAETTVGWVGFPAAQTKTEGQSVTYVDMLQGYKETFTHATYALGYRISRETWEDELYGVMNDLPSGLSRSMLYAVEVNAVIPFTFGFTDSAAYRGPDSEPLFGDGTLLTHPLKGGGTGRNQPATAVDLGIDGAEIMIEMLEETVNEQSLLGMLKAATFVVPPEERFVAKELFDKAAMGEKPHTSLRGINPMTGEDLNYFVYHWLTDPDAFFVLAEKHGLEFFWRIKPDFEMEDDFDTKDVKATSRMRFSYGWKDWRGVAGSPGAS